MRLKDDRLPTVAAAAVHTKARGLRADIAELLGITADGYMQAEIDLNEAAGGVNISALLQPFVYNSPPNENIVVILHFVKDVQLGGLYYRRLLCNIEFGRTPAVTSWTVQADDVSHTIYPKSVKFADVELAPAPSESET